MKAIIITCRTLKAEVDQAIAATSCNYSLLTLESALHNEPDKLREVLQATLDRVSNVDQVLLMMGFCGNAILGLKPEGFNLVIPKADDCITMLLGSQARRTEVQRDMPTLFFSKGWLDSSQLMERTVFGEYERILQRYGKEKAQKISQITFKHYKRLGLIDTGSFEMEEMLEKSQKYANFLKLSCGIIPGTLDYLKKMLTGPWDEDFIIINSGETITLEHLFGNQITNPPA
ncbi:DUF1638 domain-containing protein [Sporomusa sp.]|uniref:DUF1638 domain-containing protein n=1 Tax=Sporomusa sp. TaxID=2078658 RepID=UPI002C9B48FB|nr:DUF1638 domain-containing protein [Sporomusa sp.]HWR05612.1 DUF1638 domain-containing protein [Sporomusa sp.]